MSTLRLTKTVEIHDPVAKKPKDNFFNRILLALINDPRDLPIMHLILKISITIVPLAFYIIFSRPFNIWVAVVYFLLVFAVFFAPYVLMLHNISHRRLFKTKFSFLNAYPTWFLGIFFGESPETYYSHHMGVHHPENNCIEDISTTIKFRRDSFIHFMYYYLRFFLFGLVDLTTYFFRKKKYKMMVKTIIGEYTYIALAVATCIYNLPAGIVVFILPFATARFGMMAGNWGQHAFVDIDDPNNCYRNSITCVNSSYNKRCFNDGYHISHHIVAGRHWSDHPKELVDNKKDYIKERAIIFEKLDFFTVWLLLMLKMHKRLAKYYINLDDKKPKTTEEILTLFESRLIPTKSA